MSVVIRDRCAVGGSFGLARAIDYIKKMPSSINELLRVSMTNHVCQMGELKKNYPSKTPFIGHRGCVPC